MENLSFLIQNPEKFLESIREVFKEELSKQKETSIAKRSINYIKIDEVCHLLNVTKPTIYEWINKGYINKYKIGSRSYFNKQEIIDFLKSQK